MTNLVTLKGTFGEEDLVFPKHIDQTKGDFFLISKFHLEDGGTIKIKGQFGGIPHGFVQINCNVETHPTYGDTYNVTSYSYYIPESEEGVRKYLKKFFKLSDLQTQKIYNFFGGVNVLSQLGERMEEVLQIKSLFVTEKRRKDFELKCSEHFTDTESRYWLYSFNLNERQVKQIIQTYKFETIPKIKENPFLLLKVTGVGFRTADAVYLQLGNDPQSDSRILASLLFSIQEWCTRSSSLYILEGELLGQVNNYLGVDGITRDKLLSLIQTRNIGGSQYRSDLDNEIYCDLKLLKFPNVDQLLVYIYNYYKWETETAKYLDSVLSSTMIKTYTVEESELELENRVMNEQQKAAIRNSFQYKMTIIRGYGGTGKSTIINKIIQKCEKENLSYCLLAPTGKAVDVLISITGDSTKCSTLHRKMGLLEEGEQPKETITEDVIIIDESSMIALPLMYSLTRAIMGLPEEKKKRLILVGDDNQLPPIGLGKPFLDLINSNLIPQVQLTQIYRQKEDSLILENSKKVAEYSKNPDGNIISLTQESSDWKNLDISGLTEEQIESLLLEKVKQRPWNNSTDVILSAQYKGLLGVTNINTKLQEWINVDNPYKYSWAFHLYYLDDRVMHTANNWYRGRQNDGTVEREFYPVDCYFGENLQLLMKLSKDYGDDSRTRDILGLSEEIIYNGRTQSFLYGNVVIAKYENGKVRELTSEDDQTTEVYDPNVYNGNWGNVIALKTEEGWVGFSDTEKKMKRLGVNIWATVDSQDKKSPVEYVLIVDFGDKIIGYTQETILKLKLFYATTVHKSQGSQFHRVYALCLPSQVYLLDRYWLYTLLSRAQSELYYFSTFAFTRIIQAKSSLDKKRGIFDQYIKFLCAPKKTEEEKSETKKS